MASVTPSPYDEEKTRKRRTIGVLTFAIVVILLAVTLGLLLHFLLPKKVPVKRTQAVGDCHPGPNADQGKCQSRGCTWREPAEGGPWCVFPQGHGYLASGDTIQTPLGQRVNLKRSEKTVSVVEGSSLIDDVTFELEMISKDTLRVVYRDTADKRYKVPEEAIKIPVEGDKPTSKPDAASLLYEVETVKEPQFGVKVKRKSTGTVIFDTTVEGFTFSEQYIQITTRLASSHVYGFGEHNHRRLKHDMNWKKWTIFTRDVAPVDDWNLYGAQAMYMNLENDANANAVLLLNSNAMDVVLQPDDYPAITYHVIGGILDFYIFLGPTPENVVQQYTYATGRPVLPPYWALGFHLSRWDYHNLTHVKNVVDRNRMEGIPFDVQYGDIDYMESKLDFTYDKVLYEGLPAFVDELHSYDMKYIVILDHCIGSNETIFKTKLNGKYLPYSEGKEKDIFIKDPRKAGAYLEGEVWPGLVYYPDFTLGENVTEWWKDQCDDLYSGKDWGIKYDAIWIDMNEPTNFVPGSTTGCEKNKWNNPPYVPNVLGAGDDGRLYDKTICMDVPQNWGLHYDAHSLYGHSMAMVTYNTLRQQFPTKRPFVLTRSQFTGSQKYAVHWLGDNQSQWRQIPWSIVAMLEYSMFGFSFTGADICGFWFAATEQMCQRWMQLGAFYPYSRNHNGKGWPDQDPANFSPDMIAVSRDILTTRYKLLPYLYTLLHDAHMTGSTVARPLFHEFTSDNETWAVDRQFLWGPGLMISPALEENQVIVNAYFPNTRWYDYYGGKEVEETGRWHNLSTPLDKINLHVRGGQMLPYQEPANNTVQSRKNPYGLIVALGDAPNYNTVGRMVWDDGESHTNNSDYTYTEVTFTCSQEAGLFTLQRTDKVLPNGVPQTLIISTVEIWGLPRKPSEVRVDGNLMNEDESIFFDPVSKAVTLKLRLRQGGEITWKIIN